MQGFSFLEKVKRKVWSLHMIEGLDPKAKHLSNGLGKTRRNNTTQCNAAYKGPRMTNIHPCHLILKSLSKIFPIFMILDWKVEMTNQSEPTSKWWARRTWLQPLNCTFMEGDQAWVCGRWVPSCVFARCCIALIKRHKYR